ncbi:MAG: acyl carrier protein [Clostridiales bacterium]|nr:acyl carrier protein [Clostridiales bacterium]
MVFERVQKIICEQFGTEADKVTMESSILEDFEADSLDLVDLAMSLEDEFDIEVPDEELENIKTVGDIVKLIEEN